MLCGASTSGPRASHRPRRKEATQEPTQSAPSSFSAFPPLPSSATLSFLKMLVLMLAMGDCYYFESAAGLFSIRPTTNQPVRYALRLGDELLGSYHSPRSAADDVYVQSTGSIKWDGLRGVDMPTDLSEWERRTP